MVKRVLEGGWTVADAAESIGISTRRAYRWLARFKAEGSDGLRDRSSQPPVIRLVNLVGTDILGSTGISFDLCAPSRKPDILRNPKLREGFALGFGPKFFFGNYSD
jgi:transposase-like protein